MSVSDRVGVSFTNMEILVSSPDLQDVPMRLCVDHSRQLFAAKAVVSYLWYHLWHSNYSVHVQYMNLHDDAIIHRPNLLSYSVLGAVCRIMAGSLESLARSVGDLRL